ncbi:MAG TPA: hypothetical protein VL522_07040, partial [Bordetella sp.]|nr:hypothetical protein [Bordetella sp.]
ESVAMRIWLRGIVPCPVSGTVAQEASRQVNTASQQARNRRFIVLLFKIRTDGRATLYSL